MPLTQGRPWLFPTSAGEHRAVSVRADAPPRDILAAAQAPPPNAAEGAGVSALMYSVGRCGPGLSTVCLCKGGGGRNLSGSRLGVLSLQGAETLVWLASSDDELAKSTGKYFYDCKCVVAACAACVRRCVAALCVGRSAAGLSALSFHVACLDVQDSI